MFYQLMFRLPSHENASSMKTDVPVVCSPHEVQWRRLVEVGGLSEARWQKHFVIASSLPPVIS